MITRRRTGQAANGRLPPAPGRQRVRYAEGSMGRMVLLLLPCALLAVERWEVVRSGPLEVYTPAGARAAREAITDLEQLRHTLGQLLGKQDLESLWPLRVLVMKNARSAPFVLARDSWVAAAPPGEALPPVLLQDVVRILLESNAGRMPQTIESALALLLSTLEVKATRVTLGAPPPPDQRTLDWARLHLLSVSPEYSGKLRVLIGNLARGVAEDAAYRNAFAKGPVQIDQEAREWLQQGNFGTTRVPGRALDPERAFLPRPVEPVVARALLADLDPSLESYGALLNGFPGAVEGWEGRGLAGDKDALQQAVKTGKAGARACLAAGLLEEAMKKNPRWAEPPYQLGLREQNPARKVHLLKQAAELAPREGLYWRALAELLTKMEQFSEAAKAWAAAERAAVSGEERAAVRQARLMLDQQRLDAEAAARRREADEKARELETLKAEALARIRQAEAEANRGLQPLDPGTKIEPWWEGPKPEGRLRGTLQRVDCGEGRYRLAIATGDGKLTQLLIRDPGKVVIETRRAGGEQTMLPCGPVRPPRPISVQYFPKPDAKQGTAGEAAIIEFP